MKKFPGHFFAKVILILIFPILLNSCFEEVTPWDTKSTSLQISEYIQSEPQYSEFGKILEKANLISLLSVRGPYTLFLPSNSQMEEYYAVKGVSSFEEFSPEFLKALCFNHLIPSEVLTNDIGLGALRDTNALGDYLVTEFNQSDIILNKSSKIIKRDIPCANGVIQLIDKVIEPVTSSVYDMLAANPDFSLFTKGLELTGLKDTLQLISFPFGRRVARTRFTVLAVPDTTFNRFGITTVDELVSTFTDDLDSLKYLQNGFYRYMEYHVLGGTYFLNNFETKAYPILSYDNNISVTIAEDYKLNLDKKTKNYTGFVVNMSNNPGKNGTYHTIKGLLPVFEPEPTVITWETTDHFDMKQSDYYDKYYMRWSDGQNTFKNIKWGGDYMLYYFKPSTESWNLNGDCLSMSGWWWIELTTPKIMKGKYLVTGNIWNGADKSNYQVTIDGVNTALVLNTQPAITTSWGEFTWNTTTTHKILVTAKSSGLVFWDTVVFTPIK